MYEVPSKFTGLKSEPVDINEFKSLCYSLQGLGVLTVESIKAHEYPNNYYEAIVSSENEKFSLFINMYISVIGLGNRTENEEKYINKPSIFSAVEELNGNYTVLTKEILSANATIENLKKLSAVEKHEVKEWLPSTMGGLLFTWFFD